MLADRALSATVLYHREPATQSFDGQKHSSKDDDC